MINKKELTKFQKKERSFNQSIQEGIAYSSSQGFITYIISPIVESMKISATRFSLISAVSGLISPIAQLYGNRLMEKHSRKDIVKKYVLIESFSWFLMALIPVLMIFNSLTSYIPWLFLLFYSFVSISFGLSYPAFFSFLGDIIPENKRGKYIAKRDRNMVIASTIAALTGLFVIRYSQSYGIIFFGFSVMFFFAFMFRLISFLIIEKMYFPNQEFRLERKKETGFWNFISEKSNYRKFSIAQATLNFSLFIASPFFGLYLLRELGLKDNIFLFILISISPTIFAGIFSKLTGKISDKYGNVILLYISAAFFIISPLVWLISKNAFWLIFVPGIVAGIANSAYVVSVANFTFDSVSRDKRGEYIAYANILAGLGICAGSLIGGILIDYLSESIINYSPYIIVFILAALARLIVFLVFFKGLKEVRKTKEFPKLLNIHPIKAFNHEVRAAGTFTHNHTPLSLTKFKNNKK
jgi:MFS family permease